MARWKITHSDGIETETVHDMSLYDARRLFDHEVAAGRFVSMEEETALEDPFQGLSTPHRGHGELSRKMDR